MVAKWPRPLPNARTKMGPLIWAVIASPFPRLSLLVVSLPHQLSWKFIVLFPSHHSFLLSNLSAVSGGINFNSDSKDGQVQAFYEDVLQPIKFITNALSTANLTNQNFGEKPKFCLGDFEGSAILEDKGLASSRTPAVNTPICTSKLNQSCELSLVQPVACPHRSLLSFSFHKNQKCR